MLVRRVAVLLAIGLFLDVSVAQLAKSALVDWYVRTPVNYPRISSPIYHHDLRPLIDVTHRELDQRYRVATNSLGLVDAEARTVDRENAGCRVLVIGDSFTEGYGVGWTSSFAGILARRWQKRGIELLNAGVSGYSPTIYYRKVRHLFEDKGVRFDSLLVVIDISDIRDEWSNYDIDSAERVVQISDEFPRDVMRAANFLDRVAFVVLDNSVLANTTYRILRKLGWGPDYYVENPAETPPIDVRPHSPPLPPALGPVSVEPPQGHVTERSSIPFAQRYGYWALDADDWEAFGRDGLQVAAERMDRLVVLLRRHKIPLTISVHPWPTNLAAGDEESVQVKFWRAWAKTRGTGFVNLFPAFFAVGKDVGATHFLVGDFHWNQRGHALVAEEIARQYDPRAACDPPQETATTPDR